MPDYRGKLQQLLRELFQFDSADLDFGFYAVMNQRREQISQFIESDLLDAVAEGLQHVADQGRAEAQAEMDEACRNLVSTLGSDALVGDDLAPQYANTPVGRTYQTLKEALNAAVVAEDLEAQIYNDLYAFFARYYQDGDFISQRRYGRSDKYAVPYNGQEVYLHWANYDQYYVKTGVHFNNYSFTVPGGMGLEEGANVRVRLTKVDIPRDNLKGDKRFFIHPPDQQVTWDEGTQTLVIPMEYRPLTVEESDRLGTRNQQDKLLAEAHAAILEAVLNSALRARLEEPDPQKGTEQGRLAYHLNRYAAENTRDFFVHKDLGGFLRREFDYYLKAEVLRLEDIDFDDPNHARRAAARLKTLRAIGERIIAFLDQLERFQRRLFLKRKFILQSDYCLTLDKIPADRRDGFYPEILANARQLAEWQALYGLTVASEADLDQYPHLMLDTAFLDPATKARLLACFEDLDDATDGLLVHGENYQALSLLLPRYRGRIDCVYIDPPYNTDAVPIVYKNNYKDSSWLSLLQSRLGLQRQLMASQQGVMSVAIDDMELANLIKLLESSFSDFEIHRVVVNHYPGSGTGRSNVTRTHEYNLFVIPAGLDILRGRAKGSGIRRRGFRRSGTGENNYRTGRPNSFFAVLVDPITKQIMGMEPPPLPAGSEYPTENTPEGLIRVYPIGEDGSERVWSLSYEGDAASDALEQGLLECSDNLVIQRLYTDDEDKRGLLKSVWLDKQFNATTYGTNLLTDLLGTSGLFSYPKSVYTVKTAIDSILYSSQRALVLDYFAGSGTAAHAVMKLNQENDRNHKYILVEMGEYFDAVLKPRIQKVAFADEWKDGRPVLPENGQTSMLPTGQPHMFHYVRLESYDDTFHNIRFRELDGPQMSFLADLPDYTLSYMLGHETSGSPTLLDVEQFERPFDYKLLVTGEDGVLRPQPVDLVATFNFFIGLAVQTVRSYEYGDQPYVRFTGTTPDGRRACVLWRNALPADQLDAERDWVLADVLHDVDPDQLYVNGENTIPDALLIEEEFKRRMFEDVR